MRQTDLTTSATINVALLYKVRDGKVAERSVYVKS
jgi:ketosteroid isomerase-like protein